MNWSVQLTSASRMRKMTRFALSMLKHGEMFVMADMFETG